MTTMMKTKRKLDCIKRDEEEGITQAERRQKVEEGNNNEPMINGNIKGENSKTLKTLP